MKAEKFIELIEQKRFDKISKNGMTLIAERFRELQNQVFNSRTDAEIKAKFDKYSWQNKPKKQFFIYDVMRSNLSLLWWGWTTLWGIVGIIAGCMKLWNYYY